MPERAFIVAIEEYPNANGLTRALPGSRTDAQVFRTWLINMKGLAPQNIFMYVDEPAIEGRTGGTTADEIIAGIAQLANCGADATDALYVYISSHGFFYTDRGGR